MKDSRIILSFIKIQNSSMISDKMLKSKYPSIARIELFILIYLIHISLGESDPGELSSSKIEHFIREIIKTHFSRDCQLFFLETTLKKNDFFHQLGASKEEWDILKGGYRIDAHNFSLNLTNFNNVFRHTEYCYLVFMDFIQYEFEEESSSKLSDLFFQLLAKKLGPITRKNEDFYFLFTDSSKAFDPLLRMKLISKIKYKILISLALTKNEKLETTAGKFFPWPGEDLKYPIDLNEYFRKVVSPPSLIQIFPDQLNNFNQRRIRITAPYRHIFSLEIEKFGGAWRLIRGYYYFGVREFQRLFNFTYSVMPSSGSGGTGLLFKNGTWIGAVADILYDRADVAMIPAQIYQRYPHVSYSQRFHIHRIVFTVGLPKPIFTYVLIWPFNPQSWSILIFTVIAVLFVFLLINRFDVSSLGEWEVSNVIQFSISSFFEQGLTLTRRKYGRVFCFTWLILLMVLSTAYKTKLFELFVFPRTSDPPKTFYQLADRLDYNWGLESAGINSAIHSDLRVTTHPTFKRIHDRMSLETDSTACIEKGIHSNFACIIYYGQLFYVLYRNFTTASRRFPVLVSYEATFTPHTSGWTTEKRAVWMNNFDKYIGPLMDNGIIQKWKDMDLEGIRSRRVIWERSTNAKPLFTDDMFDSGAIALSMEMLQGILLAFIFLNIGCIFILFGEYFTNYFQANKGQFFIGDKAPEIHINSDPNSAKWDRIRPISETQFHTQFASNYDKVEEAYPFTF